MPQKQPYQLFRHPKHSQILTLPRISEMTLYASGPGGRIYHIVLERDRSHTLCGLKVAALKIILSVKPETGVLCKHCERLSKSEPPSSVQQ